VELSASPDCGFHNHGQAWTKCSEHVSTADRVIILETPVQQIEHKVRGRGLQHMGKEGMEKSDNL
jgi:hypothetical protein